MTDVTYYKQPRGPAEQKVGRGGTRSWREIVMKTVAMKMVFTDPSKHKQPTLVDFVGSVC